MARMDSPLAGRRALVATPGTAIGAPLVRGLERLGAAVAVLPMSFASLAQIDDAMDAAVRDLGGLDVLVFACAPAASTSPAELSSFSAADWQAATHGGLLTTLRCLQAAFRHQRDRGGSVVVVGPSVSLVGAPGLVALITLAEAQRTLVKSAARQWGVRGIRLNWIGVAAAQYDASLSEARIPPVPELGPPPPALGRVPELETDVAEAIAWLTGGGARAVTGGTFNLDGGDWMVP
jgi:NAD(P)-dependent dehydrogenase (short-subunit alcohol dehydrogenase family)